VIRDLWEEERLHDFHREDSWRRRFLLSELVTWVEERTAPSVTESWEQFLQKIRQTMHCCESSNGFVLCQNKCDCTHPLTEQQCFFDESCCDVRVGEFWLRIRIVREESRLLQLFVCNHWRYTGKFSKYSFVSKFCFCCSTTCLTSDSNVHAFSCPDMLQARNEALNKLALLEPADRLTNQFDISIFVKCVNTENLVPVAFDFVVSFFEKRLRSWDKTAEKLISLLY